MYSTKLFPKENITFLLHLQAGQQLATLTVTLLDPRLQNDHLNSMDFPTHNSHYPYFHLAFSLKKCCFYLLGFLIFLIAVLGVATLIVIFVLKPREPVFSLQTLKLDSYKLDIYSESTLFVSSVVSLTLNSENPNKVAIRYSPSRLYILNQGLVIGMIRIPEFHQPAHSYNVSIETKVLFDRVNVTQIISGISSEKDSTNSIPNMRISGDIGAYVHIFRVTLPKVKVALDCDVNIDYKYLTLSGEEVQSIRAVQNGLPSFAANSQTFAKKCSVAFYI